MTSNTSKPSKKIALITGANKGIGFEVSRQLGKADCLVLLGARNPKLGEAAAAKLKEEGLEVHYLPIDLADLASITAAAATIATDWGQLDILVNNAAVMVNNAAIAAPQDGPPSVGSLDAIDTTLRINFLGSVAVTQAMLPLLHKAPFARIVNVSSGLGSLAQNGDLAYPSVATKFLGYSASKAALNMLTVQLAYELRDTSIKVNSADPGFTATDINGHRGTQTIPEGAAEIIRLALLPNEGPTGTYSNRKGILPW